MWSDVAALFREYMGTGLIVIWYILCLVYLWMNEKRKHLRILFLYMPVILLLLYFNPVFYRLVYAVVEREIYYRILWLLPMTVVIAYTCICIYGRMAGSGERRANVFALCAAGVIMVSGSFVYSSPFFSRAENIYHVPDTVVDICDAINVPGREVMAAFPLELVQYVRQYSPVTCMPYGRETTVDRWNYYHPLRDEMEAEVIEMEKLVPLSREYHCHYVIFRPGTKVRGKPEDYGWVRFGEVDGYTIYRDMEVELIIPDLG
nr:hypothetical protein [uncultured Acetatifactor sp.]